MKALERLLVIAVALLVVANLWMLGANLGLSLAPRYKSPLERMREEAWKELLQRDPPLGTEVAELKVFKGKRVVIVVDRCTDCGVRALKSWAEAVKGAGLPPRVLVTSERPEQVRQLLDRWQVDAEVLPDPKATIARKLHAFFTPRAYVVEDGRLTDKQDKFKVEPQEWL